MGPAGRTIVERKRIRQAGIRLSSGRRVGLGEQDRLAAFNGHGDRAERLVGLRQDRMQRHAGAVEGPFGAFDRQPAQRPELQDRELRSGRKLEMPRREASSGQARSSPSKSSTARPMAAIRRTRTRLAKAWSERGPPSAPTISNEPAPRAMAALMASSPSVRSLSAGNVLAPNVLERLGRNGAGIEIAHPEFRPAVQGRGVADAVVGQRSPACPRRLARGPVSASCGRRGGS